MIGPSTEPRISYCHQVERPGGWVQPPGGTLGFFGCGCAAGTL